MSEEGKCKILSLSRFIRKMPLCSSAWLRADLVSADLVSADLVEALDCGGDLGQ